MALQIYTVNCISPQKEVTLFTLLKVAGDAFFLS
jgi:hypothetical protein